MHNQTDIEHPGATVPEAAPVAMQRGRHRDRISLARLRTERRWLVRDRHKTGLVPDPPRGRATDTALLLLRLVVGATFVLHGTQKLNDLSGAVLLLASASVAIALIGAGRFSADAVFQPTTRLAVIVIRAGRAV